ncbi:Bug family tripartite tricarboxylate transporter substrate binding protein [Verminephrobacter eiseniae]|uniref:Bug family tripartite tricarboxylate transporter substrate binding protein n=1 Tax=Verminephrobacter eiseniae TaxID=364317 RepID=UPI0022374C21|nr:tripartite tricarboxylate transporter substrate binding protein [Verminephrobacter eiseniae]MCW5238381.1 tripartite tricarboxylate transporter substrate binding protein [Verminephrobacter eiseniae]
MKKRAFVQLLGAAAWPGPVALAQAQEPWPSRPIKVIVPVTAGGTADVLAREFGRRLGERLGQPVVVENRPGANGIPATLAVARAPADGYTLLLTLTQHIQNPVQFKDAGYDPIADFTPLCRIGAAATVLAARASLKVDSATELAQFAPGKGLTFGTTALGPQVILEVFNQSAKLEMLNVPYKGEAPALTDLLGGQIDMALLTVATARAHIQRGTLKGLAVIAPKRASSLPHVATFLEQGFKEVNWTGGWYAFMAPANLPPAIAARLVQELRVIGENAAMRKLFDELNITVHWMDGPEFQPVMKRDMELWRSLVQRSGVVIER